MNALLAVALAALTPAVACLADEPSITVSGTGEVQALPNQVEIELSAAGTAEMTGDAIVMYQDAIRRTTAAFEALDMKNLEVQPQSVQIASGGGAAGMDVMIAARGMPAGDTAKAEVAISRTLRLVLKDVGEVPEEDLIRTIARLLDTAKDVGASVGSPQNSALMAQIMGGQQGAKNLVTFVVVDADRYREEAYQQAFDQAAARAARLAGLAKAKLGHVLSVEEVVNVTSDDEGMQERMMKAIYGVGGADDAQDSRLTSGKFGQIPVSVTLRVRFAMAQEASP